MKNNFFIIRLLFFLLLTTNLNADNLKISSSEVKLDKKESKVILKGNIEALDEYNNILKAEEASYLKGEDLLNSIGNTTIITNE